MPHTHPTTTAKTAHSRPSARAAEIEPLAVSPRQACRLLGCGITRLYELIGAGELESYLDGRMRRITTRSIVARARLVRRSSAMMAAEIAGVLDDLGEMVNGLAP